MSQEVSPFPVGDHKAAMNKQECMTNKKHKNMWMAPTFESTKNFMDNTEMLDSMV